MFHQFTKCVTAFLQLFYSFSTAFPQLFHSFFTAFLQLFYSFSAAVRLLPWPTLYKIKQMPVLLELFCGTKSIGKVFDQHGWDVVSVDMLDKFQPTICKNVLDLSPEDIIDKLSKIDK